MSLKSEISQPQDIYAEIPNKILDTLKKSDYEVAITIGENEEKTKFDKEHFLGSGISAQTLSTELGAAKIFLPRKKDEDNHDELHLNESIILKNVGEHKNIAKIIGIGKATIGENSYPCIVKEYLPIGLEETIKKENLSPRKAIKMISDIAEGLEHVFNKTKDDEGNGEIITDLTVENIRQNKTGDWVIYDLADTAKKGRTAYAGHDLIFSAPECQDEKTINENATEASMVYSLSLILWHSLTGIKITEYDVTLGGPEDFATQEEIPDNIYKIIQAGLRLNSEITITKPTEFAKLLNKALESEAEQS